MRRSMMHSLEVYDA
jgi:hypothetical protein